MAAIADMQLNVHVRDIDKLIVSANALIAALAPKPILSNPEVATYLMALEMLELQYKMALTVYLEIETNKGG